MAEATAGGFEFNIMIAGVGGLGTLSVAGLICNTAESAGLKWYQSEVHGMSQRGGAVNSHLRLADGKIHSVLIPKGKCDLVLSLELLEGLRYRDYLGRNGTLISSTTTVKNIPDYPKKHELLAHLHSVRGLVFDARRIATRAGARRAENIVMLGAASVQMPLPILGLEKSIGIWLGKKREKIVEANIRALRWGRIVAELDQALSDNENGVVDQKVITVFIDALDPATLEAAFEKRREWSDVLCGKSVAELPAGPLDGSMPA